MFVFDAPHAHAHAHAGSGSGAPRFSFAHDTSGRQVMDAEHHETRKRRNADHSISSIRGFTAQPWTSTSSTTSQSQFESPAPLAHDRYTLAGGSIDGANTFTPHNGNYDDYFNLQTQRGMWSSPASPSMQPLDRLTSPSPPSSWVVDSLLNLVGGVAGKLFQFCTVPFRGFHAGGGQAYDADAQIKIASKLGLHDDDPGPPEPAAPVQQIKFDPHQAHDYGVRSIDSIDSDRPRLPKRLRTEDAWVMVSPAETAATPTSTTTTTSTSTPTSTSTTPRLPSRRTSLIPRPQHRTTPTPRRSLIPISRRTHTHTHTPPSTTTTSTTKHPAPRHSLTSPLKPLKAHPQPPKTQHLRQLSHLEYKYKYEHEHEYEREEDDENENEDEDEDDARLRRMGWQMSAMLREARAALGTGTETGTGRGTDGVEYRERSSYGDGDGDEIGETGRW